MTDLTTPQPSSSPAPPSSQSGGGLLHALREPGSPLQTSVQLGLVFAINALLVVNAVVVGFRQGSSLERRGLPEEYSNIEQLFDRLQEDSVFEPDDQLLVDGALEGLLEATDDRYAAYYSPDDYADLNADLDGEFGGIGVGIETRDEGIIISSVFPDSPAEQAGITVGSRIIAVEGRDIVDLTISEVADLVKGEEGTEVTITIDDGEGGDVQDHTMTRAIIDTAAVESEVLNGTIGYVSIAQFSRQVDEQIIEQVDTMIEESDITGLILDLRNNPGGLLSESVEVVSLFVEEGVAVTVETRDATDERAVSGDARFPDIPLVVLVNEGSASAAEIVAGALQDLDRATLVGTTTFGKGVVQTIVALSFGSGAKFTTAQYFTPSGDSIDGVGVTPDVATDPDASVDDELSAGIDELQRLIAEGPGF